MALPNYDLTINDDVRASAKKMVLAFKTGLQQARENVSARLALGGMAQVIAHREAYGHACVNADYVSARAEFQNAVHAVNPHFPDAKGECKPSNAVAYDRQARVLMDLVGTIGVEESVEVPNPYHVGLSVIHG